MNSVRSSSPLSCSARTIDATPSSTASSDSSRWRYISVMPLIRAAPSRGAPADRSGLVRHVGLVERGRARHRLAREPVAVTRRRDRRAEVRRVVGLARRAGVRCEVRDGEEERLGLRREALDRVDRLRGVDVGLVVGRGAAVGHELAVLVERVAVVAVRARIDGAVPLVPAGGTSSAAAARSRSGTCRCGRCGSRRDAASWAACSRASERASRTRPAAARSPYGVVVRVLPGQERRARRAAERERDEVVRERRPARGEQSVDVRHHAHRLDGLVV